MSKLKNPLKDESVMSELPIVGKQAINESEEKFLKEICEFEFYNLEEPGINLKFPYGDTRKNHNFHFEHGQKYKVPRHVARHIESRGTPIYSWRPNGNGQIEKRLTGQKPRFQMRQIFG